MKKHGTKIICAGVAAVVATGVALAAGCSPYNKGVSLKYTPSEVTATSNGGFAVEKDGYIYFINSPENNTANNDYGTPVRGSIMRISVDNLDNGNYNAAETLVPKIAYTTKYESTGIFVYGDYIYYGTPSTKRNSNGNIQTDSLEMRRTKLDGTDLKKEVFVTFPSADYDYRFVEVDGVVYLMYVVEGETLYGESSGKRNLHSYNTETGTDTLLAYGITSYLFDAEDKTNPRVYYTMNVFQYDGGTNIADYDQVYTVTADKTEQNEYNFEDIEFWDEENDRYINCGDLVLDGIGGQFGDTKATPFNYAPDGSEKNDFDLDYTLKAYVNKTLFYTRSDISASTYLFSLKDSDLGEGWNAVKGNPEDDDRLMDNGTNAASFKYIFDGEELKAVLYSEGSDGITINYVKEDGRLSEVGKLNNDYYRLRTSSSPTILHVEEYSAEKPAYVYYSISGSNGYTFWRVDYTGESYEYEGPSVDGEEMTPYREVQILDLDARAAWYMPEFIGNYIIFSGETDNMSSYNYIMAFNLLLADMNGDGEVENKEIQELNDLYNGVIGEKGIISGYSDNNKFPTETYANLANASRYMFYTADINYVTELAKACNAKLEEGDDPVYSENTLQKLKDFLEANGDWESYAEYSRTVNGEKIFANRRDYYYSVISKMTDSDAENYANEFKTDYLRSWPEEEPEPSWYEGLSTGWRVVFIIGMCLVGILVLGTAAVVTVRIIKKVRGNKLPSYSKRRIKVDTTDDKNINVYEDESAANNEKTPDAEE